MSTVQVYSVKHGDIWQAQCPYCTWTSKNLPFKTRAEAEHAVELHLVLCKEIQ